MSPAKQKSNEKHGARDRKASSRQASGSGGTAASAYNPVSGTFHTLEPISSESGTGTHNGRFRSIDDVDDNASSNGVGAEFDSMSNNGSCSGESEDQLHVNGKEKQGAGKLGTSPGLVIGLDKRDKIRGKNERKHQRQKERRAQELRDKCTGYLMSRKLEALSQQLVAMGFSQERATMALIFNDGHVEQSVAWLLEGGEVQVHEDWSTGGSPKIDISEELGRIAEIEKKYKFARSEIERAIVSFEGDLDKAIECLQARSRNSSPGRSEGQNLHVLTNSKQESALLVPVMPHSSGSLQTKGNGTFQPAYQTRREERDITHAKGRLQGNFGHSHTPPEGSARGSTHGKNFPNPLTAKPQRPLSPAEQRTHAQGARPPSGSQTASPPYVSPFMHVADSKAETGLLFGSGGTDSKTACNPARESFVKAPSKEPLVTTQLPQLLSTSSQPTGGINTCPISSSPMFSTGSWSRGFMDMGSLSSVNSNSENAGLKVLTAGKKSAENLNSGSGVDMQGYYYPIGSSQSDALSSPWVSVGNGLSNLDAVVPPSNLVHSARQSWSSPVTSYGLYTGWGTGLSHSSIDWSMGPMANCDYKNIDWSMSASPSTTAEIGCFRGLSTNLASLKLQEKGNPGWNMEEERAFQARSGTANHVTESNAGLGVWKAAPSALGMQDKACGEPGNATAFGGHEWTSPFAGKDLITLPQAVFSPSL